MRGIRNRLIRFVSLHSCGLGKGPQTYYWQEKRFLDKRNEKLSSKQKVIEDIMNQVQK